MPGAENSSLRRRPGAAALAGVATVLVATVLGSLTWDGEALVVPLAWLLAAVLATAVMTGLQGGLGATCAATASLMLVFTDPRWSVRVDDAGDLRAIAAFAVVALLIVLAIDAIDTARERSDDALQRHAQTLRLLDGALDGASVGMALLDLDLRIVRVNRELLRMRGLASTGQLGRRIEEVLDDPELGSAAERVAATGRPALDLRVTMTDGATARPLHALVSLYAVRVDDEVAGVGALVRDVSDELEAESERAVLLSRLTRMQAATAALAASRTTDDVVAAVLSQVREAAGADAASLSLVEGDHLVVLGGRGYEGDVMRRWSRFPLDADVPLAEAVRTRGPVVASTTVEIADRWPTVARDLQPGDRALAALPLVVEGDIIGAIGLSLPASAADSNGDGFLETIATQCSQALRRAFLNRSEQTSRARLSFLAEATSALTETLEPEEMLERLAALAVPRIADWCSVYVVDDGTVRPVSHAHVDPERAAAVRHLSESHPVSMEAPAGVGAVARTGHAELHAEVTRDLLQRFARDEEHLAAILEIGIASALFVPLHAKGRVLGVLALAASGERRLGADDLALASDVGARAGQALLNAELFSERTHIADVLQRSLMPPTHVTLPGIDLATRFVPVGHGIDVGGDFYDVFRLGPASAPEDAYAVVIGDVRGKGSEAAAIAAAARHSIRTTGLRTTSPSAMLAELNEVLLVLASERPDALEPMFCTAVVAVVRPDEGGADVMLAVGGHPLPLLLCADGSTKPVGAPGTLVGVIDDPQVRDVDLHVGPGEALVLYTDGVTERHAGDRFFDEDGLAAAVSRCVGFTADTMAERIELAARAFVEDEPRDDLAIVVLRIPTRTGTSSSAAADLPFDRSAPRLARRFLIEVLAALDRDDLTEAGGLLVSEVVTNAVLHGDGPLRVSVEPTATHVRVAVSDTAAAHPEVRQPVPEDLSGRGLVLVEQLSARWGVDDLPTGGKSVWFDLA